MKKLFALICLSGLLLLAGCPNPNNDPIPSKKITITLEFDRFLDNIRSSPFGRISSSETDWIHVLSSGAIATINVDNIDNPSFSIQVLTTFPEISNKSFTLDVGSVYNINLTYNISTNSNGLAFSGTSGPVLITSTTTSIELKCSTNQSLVLLDKEGIGTVQPKFDDGTGIIQNPPVSYKLFESTLFWYLYVNAPSVPYVFQYSDLAEQLVTVNIESFTPETIYFISESQTGTIIMTYNIDSLFNNVIVIGN